MDNATKKVTFLVTREFLFGCPFFLNNGIKFVYSIISSMFLCSCKEEYKNENMETYE